MDQELFNRVMAGFDEEREPKRSVGDWAKDIGLTAAKGVVGAGEGVAGLANMATLGLSGRGLKALGYDPKATKEWLGQFHSEAHKKAQQNVSEAGKQAWQNVKDEVQGGSWRDPEVYKAIGREAKDVGRALIENPSIVASSIGESIPTMFAGGAIGKGIRALGAASKAAPKVGAWLAKPGVAGAIGEGVIGAGAAAEQIRQESPDENLTAKGALYAGLTGLGTGVLGRLGNKAMGKMGIADIEEMLAGGTRAVGKAGQKLTLGQAAKGVVGGAIGEGLFEELPQSAQETVLQNIATGKPWYEGLGESMVQGAFAGGVMGGGANVYSALPAQQRKAMAAHEAERRAERQALAQSALGNAYAQASPGVMEATSALAAQGPDDLTPAQKLAELKAELGEQLDRKDAGQGLVGLLRRAQEQKARQEAAEERAAFSGTQYADLAQPTTEEIARQNIRVTPENSVLAEGGATEVGRAVEDRLGRQEAAASAEAERSAIADMYRRLFGYEETGEGIPVDEANSRLARGEATEAGRREETRLAEREKEAERLAARQEELEEAFSQPATTPRYEAVALEDADIAAHQRKRERQAAESEAERARLDALSQRTWEPNEVPPELAERLDGLARQMEAGEAGYKNFVYDEEGYLDRVDGVKSTNPVWMRRPKTAQEKEADPDRELLSGAGKEGIRAVLRNWREGRPMTDNQRQVWAALQRKAWRHGTDDYDAQGIGQEYEDYQYAAKRGINLEAPREVAAGSLQDGDTVLVRDREGEIDAASVSTDPSTGTVTIKDGVVRRYGYGDPVQIEGLKPVERTESPIVSMLMAEQQAQRQARDAELEAQAASGTIGKALAAGDILIGEQQPGLGIGALMGQANSPSPLRGLSSEAVKVAPPGGGQDAPVETAAQAAPAGENAPSGEGIAALLGTLDAARRERGRAERPQRRQEQREAKAQRVKAAKHRQHEARFAEIGAPYHRSFAGEANWNDIIPNAQGFIEETRGRERQARQDLARGAYGTAYGTNTSDAADTALAEGRRQQRRELARSAYGTGFGTDPDRAAERVIAERNQRREQAAKPFDLKDKAQIEAALDKLTTENAPTVKVEMTPEIARYQNGTPKDWLKYAVNKIKSLLGEKLKDPKGGEVYLEPGNTESLEQYATHLLAGDGKNIEEATLARAYGVYLLDRTVQEPMVILLQKPKETGGERRKVYLSLYDLTDRMSGSVIVGVEEGQKGRVITSFVAGKSGKPGKALQEFKAAIRKADEVLYEDGCLSGHPRQPPALGTSTGDAALGVGRNGSTADGTATGSSIGENAGNVNGDSSKQTTKKPGKRGGNDEGGTGGAASGGTQAQSDFEFFSDLKTNGGATNARGTFYELQELKGNPGKFRVNATTRYGERVAVTNKGLPLNEALEYAQNISAEESGGVNLRVAVRAARENAGRQDAEQAEQQAQEQTPAQETVEEAEGVGAQVQTTIDQFIHEQEQIRLARFRARTGHEKLDTALIERAQKKIRSLADELKQKIQLLERQKKRIQRELGEANTTEDKERLRNDQARVNFEIQRANEYTYWIDDALSVETEQEQTPAATAEPTAEAGQSTAPQSAIDAEAAGISDADLEALAEDVFGPTALNEPEPKQGEKKPRTKTGKPRPKKKVTDVPLKQRAQAAKRTNQDLKSAREKLAQAAAASGKSGEQAIKEAFSGLMTLFTPKNTFGSGIVFTEESYQAAKPHFIAAWRNCQQMGLNIREFFAALKDVFGAAIAPFAVRFVQDVRDGKINMEEDNGGETVAETEPEAAGSTASQPTLRQDDGTVAGHRPGALEAVPSEVGGRDGRGGTVGAGGRSGGKDAGRDSGTDTERVPVPRSGRDGQGEVHTGEAGDGRKPDVNQTSSPSAIPARNFRITPELELGKGGETQKYNDNVAAIRTLKQIQAEGRRATPEEQAVLARYVGWGGLPNAFRNPADKSVKPGWEKRVEELEGLLSKEELDAARRSTQDAHYTSQDVVNAIWQGMRQLGFSGGNVLEPSIGAGNFLGLMPQELAGKTHFIGSELDGITAGIAKLLYPQETIHHTGFQKLPLPSGGMDAMVGNPPFGSTKLVFARQPWLNRFSIHNQFVLSSLDALRPGGVMGFVVSRYLMDSQDATVRKLIADKGKLLGAVRLPGTAFKENARTEVVTDIIFIQKKTAEEQQAWDEKPEKERRYPLWVETRDFNGGDPNLEPVSVNAHFLDERNVLGEMNREGSMRRENDLGVSYTGKDFGRDLAARVQALLPKGIMPANDPAKGEAVRAEMVENMKHVFAGKALGDISFNENGELIQIYERESVTGEGTVLTSRVVTPETPWDGNLKQAADGRWYETVDKLDANGKAVKEKGKDGKPTNRNVKETRWYDSEADVPENKRLNKERYDRLVEATKLLDLVKRQIELESSDAPEAEIEANRKKLNHAYEAFTTDGNGKKTYVNDPKVAKLVADTPNGPLLLSLESNFRKAAAGRPATATKSDILTRRVIFPAGGDAKIQSMGDALSVNLSEMGRVDIERIAELRGVGTDEVIKELCDDPEKPLIFHDPESGRWEKADEYLSGNVRRKLLAAIAERDRAAETGAPEAEQRRWNRAVAALEAVQPKKWRSDQITATAGGSWIPADVYADFYEHLTGGRINIRFTALTNTFDIAEGTTGGREEAWGTPEKSVIDLFRHLLNSRPVTVYVKTSDGRSVKDTVASQAASDKIQEIKEEFSNWVFQDAERRERLTDIFNDRFNVRVLKQYDGSHLELPGKAPDSIIKMRRHQMNAIWRGIVDRFVLYDHAVGAGKTFTGIARAMERKRMGLSRKPMIVVPNHLVNQFASDVYRLYPAAKVLAAGPQDMSASNRRRLFGRIATGDWDIVIVPHSSFNFIGIDPDLETSYLAEELQIVMDALKSEGAIDEDGNPTPGRKNQTVKDLENVRRKLEERLEAIRLRASKKDRLLTFEQMGIDDLTIDEAHEFKNLFYTSNMTDVRGMGNRQGSDRAYGVYTKVKSLRESGGSVAFMTGTPISNSAVEMFTMMRYLAGDALKEMGLEHFDAWRSQYVDASSAWEPTESGKGIKRVDRLGREWSNMRSLMDMYYSFADCVSNEDIQKWHLEDTGKPFPLPRVMGGGRQMVEVKPTPGQERIMREVMDGFDHLNDIRDPKKRNAERLTLMDRARKVSLDARAVDPRLPGDEGGKLGAVCDKVYDLYRKNARRKGTQLIFLDRSVPHSKGDDAKVKEYDKLMDKLAAAEANDDEEAARKLVDDLEAYNPNEIEELRNAMNGGWNAYQQMKDNLVAMGIPAAEIRFAQEANTDKQKQELFDAVKRGEVRVLIGSSQRMGAGTNVQDRLVALHHVDVTWKPSDIEQREGRIIRQGNLFATEGSAEYDPNFEVEIYAYGTERTIDAKMWNLNATKLKMVNGIRQYTGDFNMEFDDSDSVSMAEMAAILSGDPLQTERVQLDSEIDRLDRNHKAFLRSRYAAEDALKRAREVLENSPSAIAFHKKYAPVIKAGRQEAKAWREGLSVVIDGETYTGADYQAAKDYVTAAIRETNESHGKVPLSVEIDGVKYHAQGKIEDALEKALGDKEGFVGELNGERYASGARMRRKIAELVEKAIEGKAPILDDVRLAKVKIGGIEFDLSFSTEMRRTDRGEEYKGIKFFFEQSGVEAGERKHRIAAEASGSFMQDGRLGLNSIQFMFNNLERALTRVSVDLEFLQKEYDRAKKSLPTLEQEAAKDWPKQEEYDQKKKRKAEVESILDAQAKAAESGSAAAALRDEIEAGAGIDFEGAIIPDSRAGDAARLSVAAVPVGDRADIEAELAQGIGKTWANKILRAKNGNVRIVETQEEARRMVGADNETVKRSESGTIQGFYLNGVAYLVRDGIARGNVMAVLMHEYGEHAAQLGFRNNVGYRAILKSLENRQNEDSETGKAIQEAMKRVPEGTKPEHYWSEVAAYIVEANANIKATALDRVTNFFKKWLYKITGLGADNFTHKDLVMFARAAVKAAGRTSAKATTGDILLSTADGTLAERARDYGRRVLAAAAQWAKVVDNALNGKGHPRALLAVGATPDLLVQVGIPSLGMVMEATTLRKIAGIEAKRDHLHQLTPEQVKALYEEMADPVAVLRYGQNDYTVVTELDENGSPVIVGLNVNQPQGKVQVNEIASAYGKEGFGGYLLGKAREGKIVYLDKKKLAALSGRMSWAQSPGAFQKDLQRALRGKVKYPTDVVKPDFSTETSANGPLFSIAAPSSPAANPANNNAVTGQSFLDRILANAAPKWRDRWERFIYNFLDSNDPRERVWKRAGAPSDKDFVTIERLRGKKAAAEQKRFKREMLEPLLDTLGKAGLSVSDLEEYAHALHTPERNQRMREVNAKRTLDELMKNMPDNDRQALKDQIDFIRTQGKQNGWTESDIQKAYLDLMRDVYRNIPAREQAQRAAERALSPNSSQAAIDRVAKGAEQLAETKRIRDKWQEESVRFAGMTDADAASIIQKWQGDSRYASLQKAQRQLAAINAATLDVLHEAGELGDEEYQAMKNGYQFYVPLHRDGFQDTRPPAVGRSTGPIGSPFKVAKGSMRAVVNILANSVQAHETAINRRHKLEAGRALYEFAQAHPDAGISVERQEKKPTHDKEGNIVMYTSQAEPEDGVFVKVDGVKYLLRFNTDNSTPEGRTLARFLDSVKGADAQLGGMVKMLHQATRWLAAVNTSFSPEFVVTNFSRDFQTAFIHLNQKGIDMDGLKRAVAKDVFPAMRGIFAAERGNRNGAMARWYADYEANGGKVGWMQSYENIGDLANEIQQELKLHQKGHHGYKAWRAMTALVENGNAAIENCMRLATYKALVERGVSRQKAAMVASSLTVDFTQRGKMSPQINALYMFFNASVQGTVRMVQALATSRKVQAIAGGIAGAGFVLQMLALAGGGDDDSGEPNIFGIPESTRERNIIIMLPGSDGKRYIKIPKAYGYGALYDFGAELANSIYMGSQGRKYDHAAGAMRVVSSFANSFNPIQSATLLQALSPTLLDPVVYTAENKSWAGTPLMPEQSPYGPSKPDSYRAWKGTSPIFKKMAESWSGLFGGDSYSPGKLAAISDISPETLSMLWDTGTGGMGRFVGNVVSLPFSAMEGEVESRKVPFLRQVYGEWNDRAISSRYYEAMDRAEVAHMRFKNAENLTERKRLYQEPDHKLYLQSRESEKRIKAMRKRQQLMEAAGNKDGAERMRQRIVEEQAKVLKMAA